MALSVLDPSSSLDTVLEENSFILGELHSHPLAAPHAAKFDAFQADWFTTHAARTALVIALGKAAGAVSGVDDRLDDFVDTLDRTVLIVVKNDRQSALYLFFFGAKTPHLLKRPILGEELVTVRAWLPTLQTSTVASIAALAPVLADLVAAADAAVAQELAADQALKEFDKVGGKKTLIDAFNALRQSTYGELAALPHQNPAAMLPADFADRFFPHSSRTGITSLTNPNDVQAKIDRLQRDLAAAQSHLAALQARAEAKLAKKAAAEAAAAVLAQAKKDEATAKQKTKEAEKALDEAKKKEP